MRRIWGLLLCLCLAAGAEESKLPKPEFPLTAELHSDGRPVLRWLEPTGLGRLKGRVLLRSTTDLRTTKNAKAFPIAGLDANQHLNNFRDWEAPHDVTLYYQLRLDFEDGRKLYSEVDTVKLPAPKIPPLQNPMLAVNKSAYTLSVMDSQGNVHRRFPIALGQNPKGRKLHYDRACTPEGVYRVCGVQPQATFYKAFDLNYPNEVDRARHALASRSNAETPAIGGEIQIHGDGIDSNWTAGCIALRDRDMDLLFSIPGLSHGTTVAISGSELDHGDLLSDIFLTAEQKQGFTEQLVAMGMASGRSDKHWIYALCKLQKEHGLKVTGLFDQETRKLLIQKRSLAGRARASR